MIFLVYWQHIESEAPRTALADTDGEKIAIPATSAKNIFQCPFIQKMTRITIGCAVAIPRAAMSSKKGFFRGVMAWDAIDLRTKNGLSLPDADREIILEVAGKAILNSDQDPAVVIRAAERVGRRHDIIQNVRAYATRTINAALHYAQRKQELKERPVVRRDMEGIADLKRRDEIEKRVLVREVLEHLPAQDREIFLRRVAGEPYSKIDTDMDLTPRTAETRYRAAKRLIRQLLDQKFDPQTGSRGR